MLVQVRAHMKRLCLCHIQNLYVLGIEFLQGSLFCTFFILACVLGGFHVDHVHRGNASWVDQAREDVSVGKSLSLWYYPDTLRLQFLRADGKRRIETQGFPAEADIRAALKKTCTPSCTKNIFIFEISKPFSAVTARNISFILRWIKDGDDKDSLWQRTTSMFLLWAYTVALMKDSNTLGLGVDKIEAVTVPVSCTKTSWTSATPYLVICTSWANGFVLVWFVGTERTRHFDEAVTLLGGCNCAYVISWYLQSVFQCLCVCLMYCICLISIAFLCNLHFDVNFLIAMFVFFNWVAAGLITARLLIPSTVAAMLICLAFHALMAVWTNAVSFPCFRPPYGDNKESILSMRCIIVQTSCCFLFMLCGCFGYLAVVPKLRTFGNLHATLEIKKTEDETHPGMARTDTVSDLILTLTWKQQKEQNPELTFHIFSLTTTVVLDLSEKNNSYFLQAIQGIKPIRYEDLSMVKRIRSEMCICPSYNFLSNDLTVKQTIKIFREFVANGVHEFDWKSVANDFNLTDQLNTRVKILSDSDKSLLILAIAFLSSKEILVFDDPTYHLKDASLKVGIACFQKRKNHSTIFMSCTNVEDALRVGDQVSLVVDRVKRFDGPVATFTESMGAGTHVKLVTTTRLVRHLFLFLWLFDPRITCLEKLNQKLNEKLSYLNFFVPRADTNVLESVTSNLRSRMNKYGIVSWTVFDVGIESIIQRCKHESLLESVLKVQQSAIPVNLIVENKTIESLQKWLAQEDTSIIYSTIGMDIARTRMPIISKSACGITNASGFAIQSIMSLTDFVKSLKLKRTSLNTKFAVKQPSKETDTAKESNGNNSCLLDSYAACWNKSDAAEILRATQYSIESMKSWQSLQKFFALQHIFSRWLKIKHVKYFLRKAKKRRLAAINANDRLFPLKETSEINMCEEILEFEINERPCKCSSGENVNNNSNDEETCLKEYQLVMQGFYKGDLQDDTQIKLKRNQSLPSLHWKSSSFSDVSSMHYGWLKVRNKISAEQKRLESNTTASYTHSKHPKPKANSLTFSSLFSFFSSRSTGNENIEKSNSTLIDEQIIETIQEDEKEGKNLVVNQLKAVIVMSILVYRSSAPFLALYCILAVVASSVLFFLFSLEMDSVVENMQPKELKQFFSRNLKVSLYTPVQSFDDNKYLLSLESLYKSHVKSVYKKRNSNHFDKTDVPPASSCNPRKILIGAKFEGHRYKPDTATNMTLFYSKDRPAAKMLAIASAVEAIADFTKSKHNESVGKGYSRLSTSVYIKPQPLLRSEVPSFILKQTKTVALKTVLVISIISCGLVFVLTFSSVNKDVQDFQDLLVIGGVSNIVLYLIENLFWIFLNSIIMIAVYSSICFQRKNWDNLCQRKTASIFIVTFVSYAVANFSMISVIQKHSRKKIILILWILIELNILALFYTSIRFNFGKNSSLLYPMHLYATIISPVWGQASVLLSLVQLSLWQTASNALNEPYEFSKAKENDCETPEMFTDLSCLKDVWNWKFVYVSSLSNCIQFLFFLIMYFLPDLFFKVSQWIKCTQKTTADSPEFGQNCFLQLYNLNSRDSSFWSDHKDIKPALSSTLNAVVNRYQCLTILGDQETSGNSHLIRVIAGAEQMHKEGNVKIDGQKLTNSCLCWSRVRSKIGYCPSKISLDPRLTGSQVLELFAKIRNPSSLKDGSIIHLLSDLLLTNVANNPIAQYSDEDRHKLQLAIALVGEPYLLLLDFPTKHFDLLMKVRIWEMIHKLVKKGHAIVLASDSAEECYTLGTSFVVLENGFVKHQSEEEQILNLSSGLLTFVWLCRDDKGNTVHIVAVLREMQRHFRRGVFAMVDNVRDPYVIFSFVHIQPEYDLAKVYSAMEDLKENGLARSYLVQEMTPLQVLNSFQYHWLPY